MKKVLMVAHHYPPDGSSSGVLRPLKFSKYLPQNGWAPHILTLREALYPVRDPGLLRDIPSEATVHRTLALDSARHLAVRGRYLALFAIPDRFVSWVLFGAARGLSVIRKTGIHAIYSTSPPPTAHLIGAVLRAFTGVPWIADFRDPWIEDGIYPRPGTLRYRVEAAMEGMVVRTSNSVLVTTPYFRTELLARYPELPGQKVRVIYNGYDEADFQDLPIVGKGARFEIIHAGLVTPEFRDPFPFMRAVAALISSGDLPREGLQITFLGGGPYVVSADFSHKVKGLDLQSVVQVDDRVPHRQALQRLGQASALLLLQASDDTRSLIPAKSFEYLRIGRPILALTLEGATADLLHGVEGCYVVNPADDTGLRHAVKQLYELWRKEANGAPLARSIHRYERMNLTGELAHLLNELSSTTRKK